jgi:hypothetical protein
MKPFSHSVRSNVLLSCSKAVSHDTQQHLCPVKSQVGHALNVASELSLLTLAFLALM